MALIRIISLPEENYHVLTQVFKTYCRGGIETENLVPLSETYQLLVNAQEIDTEELERARTEAFARVGNAAHTPEGATPQVTKLSPNGLHLDIPLQEGERPLRVRHD